MTDEQLTKFRLQIDKLDADLIKLISKRLVIANKIGKAKQAAGFENYSDLVREEQVIRKVIEQAGDNLPAELVRKVFYELISASVAKQKPLKIAYLGPAGTFSGEAALSRFGSSAILVDQASLSGCIKIAEKGQVDYAMVPYENSTEGGVSGTLDLLVNTNLVACGEMVLRIHQNLLGHPKVKLSALQYIYSHPQSFSQCRRWLEDNLASCSLIASSSNVAAAEQAIAKGKQSAAIGPAVAVKGRKLTILKSNIEDNHNNTTRFLILGRQKCSPTGNDKTSIIFSVRHRPGSLIRMLKIISDENINMSKLESRPIQGSQMGQYRFFVDMDGHSEQKPLVNVLDKLQSEAATFKLLGSYPLAT